MNLSLDLKMFALCKALSLFIEQTQRAEREDADIKRVTDRVRELFKTDFESIRYIFTAGWTAFENVFDAVEESKNDAREEVIKDAHQDKSKTIHDVFALGRELGLTDEQIYNLLGNT